MCDRLANELAIVRMDLLEVRAVGHVGEWREPVDTEQLVRPADSVVGDAPPPTADVGELLRLGKVRPLVLQRSLRRPSLGERRAKKEEAEDYRRQQAFGDLHDLGGAATGEWRRPVDGAFDRERSDNEAACDCPSLREAERGPDQERKEQVRIAPVAMQEDEPAPRRDPTGQG